MSLSHINPNFERLVLPEDRYLPENYMTLEKGGDFTIVRTPDEVPEYYVFDKYVRELIRNRGSFVLNPYSWNWNQINQIFSMLTVFKRYTNNILLLSARVDAIANDPAIIRLMNSFGSQNITVAVEGISENIRNFFQKSLTNEELLKGLDAIISSKGASSTKLYYIYCGFETKEDIKEFEHILIKIDELRRINNRPTFNIAFSFTPLTSMMATPLYYGATCLQQAVRLPDSAWYEIKDLVSSYGFEAQKLGDPNQIASALTQEATMYCDKRGQSLIEYISLNGCPDNFLKPIISFNEIVEEISEEEYMHLCETDRLCMVETTLKNGERALVPYLDFEF